MGILNFFGWFGQKQNQVGSKNFKERRHSEPLPGTQLFYDQELINDLKNDHKELVEVYGQIGVALKKFEYDEIVSLFINFSSKLRSHMLKENLKLYVYLSHAMIHDEESLLLITELRSEMNQIGRTVNSFLTRYSDLPWTDDKKISFPNEFKTIGEVLVDRIQREEGTLYSLYMHPDAYLKGAVV